MKSINKSFLLGLLAAATVFTACDYEDDYVQGGVEKDGHETVFFPSDVSNSVVLGLDDETFTVKIAREDAEQAVEVPLQIGTNVAGYFDIPRSVKFEAGETEAELVIGVSEKFPPFEKYGIDISIPEGYRMLYGEEDRSYSILLNVLKEDYAAYAKGIFSNAFMSGTFGQDLSYETILEYSPMLDTYRLSDPWFVTPSYCEFGYHLTFQWDGESKVTFNNKKYETGFFHPSYGMVTANPVQAAYRAADQTLLFLFEYTVGAGSFGDKVESFQITEKF